VLDEMGIRPSVIAGTSIGALMGAIYALGMPGYRIRALTEETLGRRFDLARQLFAARSDPVQKLLKLLPIRSSLLSPVSLLDLLVPEIGERTFADLAIPLKVVATDLGARDAVVISEGSLKTAVAASIAIPLIFSPVDEGGRLLVDGGLVNPLPFELVTGEADVTIAIDVSGGSKESVLGKRPTAVEVLMQSVQILEKSITRQKLNSLQPDIYIDVDLDQFGALEFWRAKEILDAADPVKEKLRRQLGRVLTASTLAPLEPSAGRAADRKIDGLPEAGDAPVRRLARFKRGLAKRLPGKKR
jgi:NTE family protein